MVPITGTANDACDICASQIKLTIQVRNAIKPQCNGVWTRGMYSVVRAIQRDFARTRQGRRVSYVQNKKADSTGDMEKKKE